MSPKKGEKCRRASWPNQLRSCAERNPATSPERNRASEDNAGNVGGNIDYILTQLNQSVQEMVNRAQKLTKRKQEDYPQHRSVENTCPHFKIIYNT